MKPMASWTPEFCTVCDKQCLLGSVYCSERCREADIRKSGAYDSVHHPGVPISITSVDESVSESSEDDDDEEVPNMWLNQSSMSTTQTDSKQMLGSHLKSKATKIKENQFLYLSPTLKPSKVSAVTPSMSPLMIPQKPDINSAANSTNDHMSSQSVNTYKRWLEHGAV